MRSRPEIKLYLDPPSPSPGTRLLARVVLVSHSETPIAGVDVHLRGREQRFTGVAMVGKAPVPQYEIHPHVDLCATTPRAVLTPGEHRHNVVFNLPAGVPPSYHSKLSTIEYEVVVHVDIPWWPDRTARYVVPVIAEHEAPRGKPGVFCTDGLGPQKTISTWRPRSTATRSPSAASSTAPSRSPTSPTTASAASSSRW